MFLPAKPCRKTNVHDIIRAARKKTDEQLEKELLEKTGG
jgi:hypothetical protein